eukprot:Trichotokara_eunicae@DN5325_c0_g1_i1.p1
MGRRDRKTGKFSAVDLTEDHKPNSEHEKKRIIASGGQVKRLEGDIPHRVFLKGRLYPGLAMSRAIGDTVGVQAGVTSEPEVSEVPIAQEDVFVIVASDGVWEFITSAEAVSMVSQLGPARVQQAADDLSKESWHRWIEEEGCVVDDITVQVIYLHPQDQ